MTTGDDEDTNNKQNSDEEEEEDDPTPFVPTHRSSKKTSKPYVLRLHVHLACMT